MATSVGDTHPMAPLSKDESASHRCSSRLRGQLCPSGNQQRRSDRDLAPGQTAAALEAVKQKRTGQIEIHTDFTNRLYGVPFVVRMTHSVSFRTLSGFLLCLPLPQFK